ncbi:MAG: response regulator [Candidatus Sumerlaeaceae bacterium]|nr:response regulator [Candidatus Sumerlaeaceae bacterium]
MAGENILVVDDNVAVQELIRAVLEPNGYRVTVAANGVAALTFPDLEAVDLLIVDAKLRDITGLDTTRMLKSDDELYHKPVLLLIPEEDLRGDENPTLMGANGWIKKPFEPELLLKKVHLMIEEKAILEKSRQYLREAAEATIKRLAEAHIQAAVEQRTQIIIERVLQLVVSQVDQRARREVDERVTQLTAEKQEELVKMTVHEVARSMVEKLAERKVAEAVDMVLRDETERAVRRTADSILPGLVRERVREALEQTLPREIQRRVQKEVENLVPEASQRVVGVIDAAAQKVVPKLAKELTGEIVEKEVSAAIDKHLPNYVEAIVGREIETQMRMKIAGYVRDAVESIRKRTRGLIYVTLVSFLVGIVVVVLLQLFAPGGVYDRRRQAARPVPASTSGQAGEEKGQQGLPSPTQLLEKLRKSGGESR